MAYNLLKGKRGIITGALDQNSIAWKVAEKAHEEGATFVLTNAPIAMRMGEINGLAEKTNSKIIPADATSVEELTNLFTESQQILGGKIDFVLHSIGMSVNIRKKIAYPELNYDYYAKGVDVSAMSLHKMLSVAYNMDALNEEASVVALTYAATKDITLGLTQLKTTSEATGAVDEKIRSLQVGYNLGPVSLIVSASKAEDIAHTAGNDADELGVRLSTKF